MVKADPTFFKLPKIHNCHVAIKFNNISFTLADAWCFLTKSLEVSFLPLLYASWHNNSPVELGFNLEKKYYVAEIWHRGPLWVLEPPEKKRNRLEKFWTLFRPFFDDVTFQYKSLYTKFLKISQKGILTLLSERSWKVNDENGVLCKIVSFRPPIMAQNDPKSAIFLDDVIDSRKFHILRFG